MNVFETVTCTEGYKWIVCGVKTYNLCLLILQCLFFLMVFVLMSASYHMVTVVKLPWNTPYPGDFWESWIVIHLSELWFESWVHAFIYQTILYFHCCLHDWNRVCHLFFPSASAPLGPSLGSGGIGPPLCPMQDLLQSWPMCSDGQGIL